MSKNFIPTAHVGSAHMTDIYNVQLSKPFTVTASGDGLLKLWKNSFPEGDQPEDYVYEKFVSKQGIHHSSFLHFIHPDTRKEYFYVACVTFAGELKFYQFDIENKEFLSLEDKLFIKFQDSKLLKNNQFWLVKFLSKNINNKVFNDKLILSTIDSKVISVDLLFNSEEEIFETSETFELQMTEKTLGNSSSINSTPFITSLDATNMGNNLITLGFNTGHVLILNLFSLRTNFIISLVSKPIRCVKISNKGKLLAVAHDMGVYGCVSLYDIETGDYIGDYTNTMHSTNTNSQSLVGYAHSKSCMSVDFNPTDEYLLSSGLDGKFIVWETITREKVASSKLSCNDIENVDKIVSVDKVTLENLSIPGILDCKYIPKNVRGGLGGAKNEGIVVVSLDRGVRWFREAGGI
ncbi:hypothetical protein QEN19_001121 [Hanseniaspora menglaensis]